MVSCNSRKIEGIYYYEKSKDESTDLFSMGANLGRNIAGSMIGQFEFKNGKCYLNIMGVEQRIDYEIEDSVIYLGSNAINSAGIGIRIIDDNTLLYAGCIFRKRVENDKTEIDNQTTTNNENSYERNDKNNSDRSNNTEHNEPKLKPSSSDSSDSHFALIKNVYKRNGDVYLVVDYVELTDEYGLYKNKNPKLRTLKLRNDCEIDDCKTDEKDINIDNIENYKFEIISTKGHEFLIRFELFGDEISLLNLGCMG